MPSEPGRALRQALDDLLLAPASRTGSRAESLRCCTASTIAARYSSIWNTASSMVSMTARHSVSEVPDGRAGHRAERLRGGDDPRERRRRGIAWAASHIERAGSGWRSTMSASAPAASAATARNHPACLARRVAGIDGDGEIGHLPQDGDGADVERVPRGRLEGADPPLAEDHLTVPLGEDVQSAAASHSS